MKGKCYDNRIHSYHTFWNFYGVNHVMTSTFPVQNLMQLLSWYRENARELPFRGTGDPYRIWISEIMLQQTRAAAVIRYFERFTEKLPDVYALAAVGDDELMKLWEGLGYYTRARNLKKCAQVLVQEYGGRFPEEYDELLRLPGIGFYTAGAIASIAFKKPVPAVDGNVLRVMSRLTDDTRDVCDMKTKRAVFEELSQSYRKLPDPKCCGDLNQAFMDLGSEICVPGTPKCGDCPLSGSCKARREGPGRPSELPVRKKSCAKRVEKRTILVICAGDRILLHRRPDKGLLAGLFEFPGLSGHRGEKEVLEAAEDFGFEPLRVERLADRKHVFTHVIWDMIAYRVRVADPGEAAGGNKAGTVSRRLAVAEETEAYGPLSAVASEGQEWLWVSRREAGKSVPVPSAFAGWL